VSRRIAVLKLLPVVAAHYKNESTIVGRPDTTRESPKLSNLETIIQASDIHGPENRGKV
jgi:hypothetical protein